MRDSRSPTSRDSRSRYAVSARHRLTLRRIAAHQHRVAALALRLGLAAGLRGPALALLTAGAHLHDLGKAAVPVDLLTTPATLTPQETALLRQHPVIGSRLAAVFGWPREICTIIRHHHERWDGTGYPDGLRGPAIPLLARIVAVADAYDAMTSPREYRAIPHRSAEEALLEIERCAGTQFDPWLADLCLDLLRHPRRTPA